jgi:hypothetical protein
MGKTNGKVLAINFVIFALLLNFSDNSSASSIVSRKSVAGKKKKCELCEHIKKECVEVIGSVAAAKEITVEASGNSYQPYLQVGGTRFLNVHEAKIAATVDLFAPLWQNGLTDLVFTDLRVNDRSGTPFEGNIHLGYRHLFSESQQSFGIYGAFDRRKTESRNYFNQITVGGEYWIKKCFIGANYYQPVGNTQRLVGENERTDDMGYTYKNVRNFVVTQSVIYEKAMRGTDAEVGYEFLDGLVGYAGGYYFGASEVATVYGPRVRLSYDWSLGNGRKIFGIFDKVGLEAGVQRDKPRGATGYLSANIRIGHLSSKQPVLNGISRHMIDPVRRDIDIVSTNAVWQKTTELTVKRVANIKELKEALKGGYSAIDVHFDIEQKYLKEILLNTTIAGAKPVLVIDDVIDIQDIAKYAHNLKLGVTTFPAVGMGKIEKSVYDKLKSRGYKIQGNGYKRLIELPTKEQIDAMLRAGMSQSEINRYEKIGIGAWTRWLAGRSYEDRIAEEYTLSIATLSHN